MIMIVLVCGHALGSGELRETDSTKCFSVIFI